MDPATQELVKAFGGSIARHAATAAGVWLAGHQLLASSDESSFINMAAGILLAAAGMGWSWWQKSGQAQVAAELAKWKATGAGAQAVKSEIKS